MATRRVPSREPARFLASLVKLYGGRAPTGARRREALARLSSTMRAPTAEHRELAAWAAACAARLLPIFEKARPRDARPREAVRLARAWTRGKDVAFRDVRAAALAAHAAARATPDPRARAAARAAGHAVATIHAPRHALGPAIYATKAVADADKERAWQKRRMPAWSRGMLAGPPQRLGAIRRRRRSR